MCVCVYMYIHEYIYIRKKGGGGAAVRAARGSECFASEGGACRIAGGHKP